MNILTFDIEEWFHILDHPSINKIESWTAFPERIVRNTDRILSILQELNQPATFFCLGWIARHHPEIIRKIDRAGHEIGCHSSYHQLVYSQTPSEFKEDLVLAISGIEAITGKKVTAYRAPGFSITETEPWAFEILAECGIRYDSSVFPASRAHGGFPSFGESVPSIIRTNGSDIFEFPINTARIFSYSFVFSGGGYFRLIPYPVIRYLSSRSEYLMTYFHPQDFDPGKPVISDLSLYRKFKSRVGLKKTETKLKRLITGFPFIDLKTAVQQVRWDLAPVIRF